MCLSTFFKDGELDYTYAAVTIDLVTGNKVGQYKDVQNVNLFECPVCRFIVKGVRTVCEDRLTRVLIESVLIQICIPIPPGAFRRICDDTVHRHFSEFVNLILTYTDDGKICRMIKLCGSQSADTEKEEFPMDNGTYIIPFEEDVKIGECLLCKAIVKAVKEIVKHSFKRDQVKRALSKVCRKVHSNRCHSFLNKHFNQLVDLISNGATRGKVCRVIMVCSAEIDFNVFDKFDYILPDYDFVPFQEENVKIGECLVCNAIVKAVKEIVKHSFTKDQVKRALSKVCRKVHSNKCQRFLNKHFNQLVDLISNGATRGRACRVLMVCSSDTSVEMYFGDFEQIDYTLPDYDIIPHHEENVESGECLICNAIVTEVNEVVKHSFTRDQVQNALRKICRKVHSNKCQSFLNKHFSGLVDFISNGATRGRECNILVACSPDIPTKIVINDFVGTDQNIPNYGIPSSDILSNSELLDFEVDQVEKKKHDCAICKAVVATAKAIIKTVYTRDQINDALGKVCGKLHKFGSKCQRFVNTYADTLVDLLQNAATRNRVCALLKLCSITEPATAFIDFSSQHIDESSASKLTEVDKKKHDCVICKAVVATAKAIIKTSYNRDQIKDALRKVCGKLHKFGSKCQNFVNKYSDRLIDLLQNSATRNRVCSLLKLCSIDESTPLFLSFTLSEDIKRDDEDFSSSELTGVDKKKHDCAICKAVIATAKAIIRTSYNRDQIKDALRKVCGKLHKFGSKCQNFVNKYSDRIIDLLQSAATRNRVCSLLKLCSADDSTPLLFGSLPPDDVKQDDEDVPTSELTGVDKKKHDCAICKAVIATAKAIIRTSYNRDQIKDALRKVCGKLHKFGSKCQNFVNKYSDRIIDLLQSAATRNRVCSLLKLCSADDFAPQLFGPVLPEKLQLDDADTEVCHSCQFALNAIKSMVRNNNFVVLIQNGILNICGLMPSPLRDMCMSEVKMHWLQWLNVIHHLNERKVCHSIRLCRVELYASEEVSLSGNDEYESCIAAGHLMKNVLNIPSAVQKLHDAVYQICNHISPSLIFICNVEIDRHWDEWMVAIQTTTAQQICRNARMNP